MTDKQILCIRCNKILKRKRKTNKCISCCKIGKKHSEKTKKLMSKQRKNNKFSLGFKHTIETRKKMSESKKGKNSYMWKKYNLSYSGIHCWLKATLGKAKICTLNIKHKGKRFEWHCIDGRYEKKILSYISLCPSCHKKIHSGKLELSYG
jgi:hypothetical protein